MKKEIFFEKQSNQTKPVNVGERKLNIAIIDDERHAIETLVYDLRESFGEYIQIVFTETNPFEGARKVRLLKPDVLFLDMMMPGMSGFQLINLINDLNTKVVFTTAYPEMIKQSNPAEILACLLKPVSTSDLEGIFSKVWNSLKNK
jgi:two-component system, LytTR family, response regulator